MEQIKNRSLVGKGIAVIDGFNTGNAQDISLAMSFTEDTVPNNQTIEGGNAYLSQTVDAVTLTFNLYDWTLKNLALALRGEDAVVAAAPFTGLTVAANGKTLILSRPGSITTVEKYNTVTEEWVAAVEGTDYVKVPGGVTNISAVQIRVAGTYEESVKLEALNGSSEPVAIQLALRNKHNATETHIYTFHKCVVSPTSTLGFISDAAAPLTLTAEVLFDAEKSSGGANSGFFNVHVART